MRAKKLAKAALKLGVDTAYIEAYLNALKDHGRDSDEYANSKRLLEKEMTYQGKNFEDMLKESGLM